MEVRGQMRTLSGSRGRQKVESGVRPDIPGYCPSVILEDRWVSLSPEPSSNVNTHTLLTCIKDDTLPIDNMLDHILYPNFTHPVLSKKHTPTHFAETDGKSTNSVLSINRSLSNHVEDHSQYPPIPIQVRRSHSPSQPEQETWNRQRRQCRLTQCPRPHPIHSGLSIAYNDARSSSGSQQDPRSLLLNGWIVFKIG